MGHRRWLSRGHRFRLNRVRFNGQLENRDPPKKFSGTEILRQIEAVDVTLGKNPKRGRGKRSQNDEPLQWRKRSIFFRLPYWEFNLLRHNLDVMHIEKNVCDNVLFTLLNDASRTKDHVAARKDLQSLGIRKELWPNENGKCPAALYSMTKEEKTLMLQTLHDITVPDGYSSNLSRCIDVTGGRIFGLKSHDSHILMQQLLPLAIRNCLPIQVASVLIDLCSYFKLVCMKVVNPNDLDKLEERVVLTLCYMEMLFPPSFFTVMVHLTVHLVEEVKNGGPVYYRWMYPIER